MLALAKEKDEGMEDTSNVKKATEPPKRPQHRSFRAHRKPYGWKHGQLTSAITADHILQKSSPENDLSRGLNSGTIHQLVQMVLKASASGVLSQNKIMQHQPFSRMNRPCNVIGAIIDVYLYSLCYIKKKRSNAKPFTLLRLYSASKPPSRKKRSCRPSQKKGRNEAADS